MVDLLKIWQILMKTSEELRYSKNQKIIFEILLVKICHLLDIINPKKINQENKNKPSDIELSYNKPSIITKKSPQKINPNLKNQMLIDEVMRNFPNANTID